MKAHVITDHKLDVFCAGLAAAGYEITKSKISKPKPYDVLLAWNRKFPNEQLISEYERAGCRVYIAENGYIGRDEQGRKLISLSLSRHAGAGKWFIGSAPRHERHGFIQRPWRAEGEEIIVLGQRGIGASKNLEWADDLRRQIKKKTRRPVRLRPHPGKDGPPLEPDLDRAHAVVTWSSAAAIQAIAYGVPAFYFMPDWIAAPAAVYGIDDLESPFLGDRNPMFHRLGWAQWTVDEVASGEAFKVCGAA